jgi:hypothetical protein
VIDEPLDIARRRGAARSDAAGGDAVIEIDQHLSQIKDGDFGEVHWGEEQECFLRFTFCDGT